jgi:hypothetical protein
VHLDERPLTLSHKAREKGPQAFVFLYTFLTPEPPPTTAYTANKKKGRNKKMGGAVV